MAYGFVFRISYFARVYMCEIRDTKYASMWSRRILTVVFGLLAGLFDATVAVWLPGELTAIRLSLPFVAALAAFSLPERAIAAALAAGAVSDALLPAGAGLVTLRFVVVALIVSALARSLFTNRSLAGALALVLIAFLLDRALLAFASFVFVRLMGGWLPEARAAWWAEIVWLWFVMTSVFVLFASFTRRFLPPISKGIRE